MAPAILTALLRRSGVWIEDGIAVWDEAVDILLIKDDEDGCGCKCKELNVRMKHSPQKYVGISCEFD